MADIKPTRSELMKLKKKIKLAKSGYNLLKKKRDGLILEFFEILKHAKTLRQELAIEYKEAQHKMNIARTLETDLKIKSLALAVHDMPTITLQTKNIMGVVVPKIETTMAKKGMKERGYGIVEGSSVIDEAAAAYERVVEKTIKAAEVETAMKRLLQEIEKTKRRVNALEFSVIPKMQQQEKFIKLRLEEMERENVFRLKRIKD
ncbi:V-type ATP synthase subunit D [Candidatus Woesearchaeota archaeon]|nr:V-type ATP synthase subunit D [Candidatus Woesearchaeota archaeon]